MSDKETRIFRKDMVVDGRRVTAGQCVDIITDKPPEWFDHLEGAGFVGPPYPVVEPTIPSTMPADRLPPPEETDTGDNDEEPASPPIAAKSHKRRT